MDKFLQVIVVLGLMSYGVKGVVNSQVENLKEATSGSKAETAKALVRSVSAPVEVNGQKIEMNGDVDVNQLYGLAQQEADKMMKTGDISAYQKQLEGNSDMQMLFGVIGGSAKSAENIDPHTGQAK